MTPRDLIYEALEILGVTSAGETPSAADFASSLRSFRMMIDGWSTQSLLIPATTREVFPLISTQGQYTMGPSGDFDTSRPMTLLRASLIYPGNPQNAELPLDIINLDQYADIVVKDLPSSIPTRLFYQSTSPLATLTFWPVPTEALSVALYSDKPLAAISNVSTEMTLPPGYDEAIAYNLAQRLSPKFGRPLSAEAADIAQRSLADIQRKNIKPLFATPDTAGITGSSVRRHGFNIFSGE